jgi:phage baseplate assembly protein W
MGFDVSNLGTQQSFGTCWSCVTDLTMPAVMVTGYQCVAEATIRRLTTPRGRLIDDANYGFDLTQYVNASLASAQLSQIAKQCDAECAKDERVKSAATTLTFIGGVLMAQIVVNTTAGPFLLVASVTNVTVTLLQVSPQ